MVFGYYGSFVIGYCGSFVIGYYGSLVIGYYGSFVIVLRLVYGSHEWQICTQWGTKFDSCRLL